MKDKEKSEAMERTSNRVSPLLVRLLCACILLTLVAAAEGTDADKKPKAVPEDKLIAPGAPSLGPAGAKAVIVEFSDFQCPYCSDMAVAIASWWRAFPEDIRVVWMDRPLVEKAQDGFPFHPFSMIAHEAAAEALEQGKFWEMQKWIFERQAGLFPFKRPENAKQIEEKREKVKGKLIDACDNLGIDSEKMKAALEDGRHREKIEQRLDMARALGVNGTPTVYLNGVEASYEPAELKKEVELVLGKELP